MALSERQRRTVHALADTFFPAIGSDDPTGSAVVPEVLDDFLVGLDPEQRKGLSVVLTLFELGAIPLHGRPFSRLSPAVRERYVDGWMRSRLAPRKIVFRTLRNLFANLYYQDPRSWPFMGYAGPKIDRGSHGRDSSRR